MEACNNLFTPFVGILFNEGLFSFSARTPISRVCVCFLALSGDGTRGAVCVCWTDVLMLLATVVRRDGSAAYQSLSAALGRRWNTFTGIHIQLLTVCWTYARTSGSMQHIHRSSSSSSSLCLMGLQGNLMIPVKD